ncbi:hypothetical protein PAHAL_3G020300 [Panicum hallii]|uniref:Uncharacterized protein n=2 Tax=Panicum hallii TaxID=206008 RepID=A0A2T8KGV5_9POAL|nr:hypothetical protein PAHAL_3G020300 [Panicum hallii]
MLLVVPSVLIPPQHPTRPAASGCRSGQRGGFFLEAAVNPGGIYPPSRLRLRQRLRLPGAATTNRRAMSPTPAAAPSGDEEFTEVVVVRHGETSWNASRIVQGGGESLNQLTERCVSYLNKIAQEHIGILQT